MLYSIILWVGLIAICIGTAIVVRKLVLFLLTLFFGSNYTIRYKGKDGGVRTVRVRADKGLSVDEIIEAIERERQHEGRSPQ